MPDNTASAPRQLVKWTLPLTHDLWAYLYLPRRITPEEAERLDELIAVFKRGWVTEDDLSEGA